MNRDVTLEAFCTSFNKLDKNCTKLLYELYTQDVIFIDPFHRIDGIEALEAHFMKLYENVTECRFSFHERMMQGQEAYVTWTMHLTHPRLAGGKPLALDGCSQLHFSAGSAPRVYRHRDYFDAGAMLYEQLPLLGPAVRWVKHRVGS